MLRKPEPTHIRGVCVTCNKNPQKKRGNGYRAVCSSCDKRRWNEKTEKRVYRKYLKDSCERCGFIPEDVCQLDIHHLDNNHHNNDPTNLQTLCANCHRLETKKASKR